MHDLTAMDLTLPPEDLTWKARAKAFAESVLFPHELELEAAGKLPRATKDALRAEVVEHGLNGVNHTREVGGQGCTQMQQTLINEELGKATGALLVEVENLNHLTRIIKSVRKVKGITEVARRERITQE